MKKKIVSAICCILLLFMLVACDLRSNPNSPGNPSNPSNPSSPGQSGKIKISNKMFDGLSADLSDSVSAGIVKEDEDSSTEVTSTKSYFVVFDSSGDISRVVFRTTVQDSEEAVISQDDIDGQADKMYVANDFIFISFTSKSISSGAREQNTDYDKKDYKCDSDTQSFAIHKNTGKVYSLSNFASLDIIEGNIIFSNNNYYSMAISGQQLSFTDILPNKSITISKVDVDNYGTIFVKNDTTVETIGNFVYYTSGNVSKGSDGYMYEITEISIWDFTIKYYNQSKILVDSPRDRNFTFKKSDWSNTYLIKGRYLFELNSILTVSYDDGRGYYDYWGSLNINAWDDLTISNELFLIVTNQDSSKSLTYFNLTTIGIPVINNYDFYSGIPNQPTSQSLMTVTSATVRNNIIYAITETVMGQKTYMVYYDSAHVLQQELVSDVGYERNILTVQPLN